MEATTGLKAAFVAMWLQPRLPLRATRLLPRTRAGSLRDSHLRVSQHARLRCTMASAPDATQTEGGMFATDSSFAALGVSERTALSLAAMGITTPTKAQAAVVPLVLRGLQMQARYAAAVRAADEAEAAAEATVATTGSETASVAVLDGEELRVLEADATGEEAATDVLSKRPRPPVDDLHDVMMVGAETGSGKTLAYLLPYVETLRQNEDTALKAVILVPSRELCRQVASFLTSYFTDPPRHVVLAGGLPPDAGDIKEVRVVIATPSALLNYFRFSQKVDASDKLIVVDEADMLLSGSFLRDVAQILDQPGMKPFATRKNGELRRVNRNRLLFIGATYPHWTGEKVRSIVTWMRRRYPEIKSVQTEDIHKRSVRLRSRWQYMRTAEDCMKGLIEILERDVDTGDKVMIFASKAETIQSVVEDVKLRMGEEMLLEKFGGVLQLHKNVRSTERTENLEKFRSGEGRLLFCTDLGARGLDLGNVTRVVEFQFSQNVVGYLHRIGRTARAGAAGATDHFYDEVSRPLADAIRERSEKETTVVEGVFSRNRSFRRKLKKMMAEDAEEEDGEVKKDVLEDLSSVPIDEVDEEEEARLRGG